MPTNIIVTRRSARVAASLPPASVAQQMIDHDAQDAHIMQSLTDLRGLYLEDEWDLYVETRNESVLRRSSKTLGEWCITAKWGAAVQGHGEASHVDVSTPI
jgi:hypothetical protein